MSNATLNRRQFITAALGITGALGLAACTAGSPDAADAGRLRLFRNRRQLRSHLQLGRLLLGLHVLF